MSRPESKGPRRRLWIPIVVTLAFLIGAGAVYRLHGIFGSNIDALIGTPRSDNIVEINPKTVTYELFGPARTSGMISYLDGNSLPQETNFTDLPWRITITTTLPSMVANIIAQGDGGALGCRIIVNGGVRDEQSSTAGNAATFCVVKSA
jgi:Mycobacterium membrane protein